MMHDGCRKSTFGHPHEPHRDRIRGSSVISIAFGAVKKTRLTKCKKLTIRDMMLYNFGMMIPIFALSLASAVTVRR